MPADTDFRTTLRAVANVMAAASAEWWVIGSAAACLQGAGVGMVADVDVLLGVEDARRLLPSLGLRPAAGSAHRQFRSEIFATWSANPVAVEFMAGFEHRAADGWRRVAPGSREPISIDGATLYVPSLDDLRRLLLDFGRTKDIARAKLLVA